MGQGAVMELKENLFYLIVYGPGFGESVVA